MFESTLAAAALGAVAASGVTQQPSAPVAATAEASPIPAVQAVPPGTPLRLMVLREINSRTARAGDRFKLRVNEPVFIDGKTVIPVGAVAWGEVVSTEKNGAVGKGGKLGARLLYLEVAQGRQPLRGELAQNGDGNGAGVVLAVVGFGIFGLLTGGDSARFKAGDQVTAYAEKVP